MGRPSKLTPKQWDGIEKRLLAGEACRKLADEFGIAESAIRKRCSAQKQIKSVAKQMVAAEVAYSALPLSAQISARTLADELREISTQLAGAARYGAATSHRLSGIAHAKVQLIDDAAPLSEDSMTELKGIAALTRMANEAAEIPLGLMRANKDFVDDINKKASAPVEDKEITIRLVSANGN